MSDIQIAPHAALIFLGASDLDISPFHRMAEQALADHDDLASGRRASSDDDSLIAGDTVYVRLETQDDVNPQNGAVSGIKLTLTVARYPDATIDPDKLHGILTNIVARSFRKSDADFVEWLSPDTLLDREEFLEVMAYVPKRRSSRDNAWRIDASERIGVSSEVTDDLVQRLDAEVEHKFDDFDSILASNSIDGWDPAEVNLAKMFRVGASEQELIVAKKEADEQLSAPMKAATWALTGTVATMSLPVAVTLSIVTVAKGEDFRLSTQALALTGFIGALLSNGMFGI